MPRTPLVQGTFPQIMPSPQPELIWGSFKTNYWLSKRVKPMDHARVGRIFAGTSEIMKTFIARALLGSDASIHSPQPGDLFERFG